MISFNKKSIAFVVLLLTLAAWFFLQDSPETRLKNRLVELARLGSIAQRLQPIEAAERANTIASFFDEQFVLELDIEGLEPRYEVIRDEIKKRLMAGLAQVSKIESSITILELEITEDSALITAEVSALASMRGRKDSFLEMHKVQLFLREVDGEWLLAKVQHLENLRE